MKDIPVTIICVVLFFTATHSALLAQVGISDNGAVPAASAILDASSVSKGFLPPRMTYVQACAIVNPVNGLLIYCTDCGATNAGALSMYSNGQWIYFEGHCLAPLAPASATHTAGAFQITWNWSPSPYATGYLWSNANQRSTAVNIGNVATKTETNLVCNTPYTRYLWAINGCDTSVVTTLTMTTTACMGICGQPVTDTRDGKVYNTVAIGTQCWMAQNMNIGSVVNGDYNQINNSVFEKYCYGNSTSNCTVYGGLYQWAEALQYYNGATNTGYWTNPGGTIQGICPAGWHLPTEAEYTTLVEYLGGDTIAGGKMKEAGLAHFQEPNTGATNSSGFTGLPGGVRSGGYSGLTSYGYFWTTQHQAYSYAYCRVLSFDSKEIWDESHYRSNGYSVRCLKDVP